MIERVIVGGQTGADQAGWRAARAAGIPTGGWMPKGFPTEDGPRPEFAGLYGARELPTADYGARTDANVRDAEWVVWFGDQFTPGGRRTYRACERTGADWIGVEWPRRKGHFPVFPEQMAHFLMGECRVLMVAGNRESKAPGIGYEVERYMGEVFRLLREG